MYGHIVNCQTPKLSFKQSVHSLIVKPKQVYECCTQEKVTSTAQCDRQVADVVHIRQAAETLWWLRRSRNVAETWLAETKSGPKVTFDPVSAPKL